MVTAAPILAASRTRSHDLPPGSYRRTVRSASKLGQLDSDEADRIVQEGLARFGRIDTLVNNAGIFIAKPFVDYTEEDFAKIFAVSVVAFFRLTRRVVPEMLGAHRADHD